MIVGIARETRAGERRVALVPDAVPALVRAKLEVVVEPGAGAAAGFGDDLYRDKHALTKMAQEHLRTHDHTYPNGKKSPLLEEVPLHIGKPVERDRTR